MYRAETWTISVQAIWDTQVCTSTYRKHWKIQKLECEALDWLTGASHLLRYPRCVTADEKAKHIQALFCFSSAALWRSPFMGNNSEAALTAHAHTMFKKRTTSGASEGACVYFDCSDRSSSGRDDNLTQLSLNVFAFALGRGTSVTPQRTILGAARRFQ